MNIQEKSQPPAIYSAKRKDGSSVKRGDLVLIISLTGQKWFGRIESIDGVCCFASRNYARLQTYSVRCNDGQSRPSNAWNTFHIIPKNRKRKSS